jgi:hypothetical protein
LPFAFSRETAELDDEIQHRIAKQAVALRETFMSPQNVYRMKHGRHWKMMHSSDPDTLSEVGSHSTETEISRTRVIDHDVSQLTDFLSNVSRQLHDIFLRTMFETLEDATRKSGNIVSGKGKSFKESFEELLTNISFGVDRYGTPSGPQAVVPPSVMKEIEDASRTPDPEYDARIAKITRQKEDEAIADEARRISRYRITC